MVKVVVDDVKGLVQKGGTGLEIKNSFAMTSGHTIEAPAAAAAVAASTISTQASFVSVTNANNSNDRIYLPSPTDVPLGHMVVISALEAFELSSKGDGTTATTINGVAVTNAAGVYSKELAVAAGAALVVTKIGDNAWSVILSGDGTPD
tara:strand:- start:2206 stop:2652 length:447 start_codon:yes stop_codon:yes gene_type:complete